MSAAIGTRCAGEYYNIQNRTKSVPKEMNTTASTMLNCIVGSAGSVFLSSNFRLYLHLRKLTVSKHSFDCAKRILSFTLFL